MRSRDSRTEIGQPKLRNTRMVLVELAPPGEKAKPGASDSLYPRIMRNARKGENAKPPVRSERQWTKTGANIVFPLSEDKREQAKISDDYAIQPTFPSF